MKPVFAGVLVFLLLMGIMRAEVIGIQNAVDGFDKQAMDATFALYGSRVIDNSDSAKTAAIEHFLCTATAVQKVHGGYMLLSAGHCVANEPADVTFKVSEQIGAPLVPVLPVSARLDGPEDYSLFFLPTAKRYPVMKLGDESSEHVGDDEINVNFSLGLTKQLAFGKISSQEMPKNIDCDLCEAHFLLQEFAAGGASGSLVISQRTHKAIGIVIISVGQAGIGVEPMSVVRRALTEPDQYKAIHQLKADDDQ